MNRTRILALLASASLAVLIGATAACGDISAKAPVEVTSKASLTLTFSLARYPAVADHIRDAIAAGESSVCTLDREGADDRRADAVAGHGTAKGKDRDEYPSAICTEGGKGASVRLVPSGENRSAGAWMGDKLEQWPDGTRVRVAVGK